MNIIIIYGAIGSGKTTKALEILPDDYIEYTDLISSGDLQTSRTVFIDDCETLKKEVFKKIVKLCKGDLVLATSDLSYIDKSIKSNAKKINVGKLDRRKGQTIRDYPNSTKSSIYDENIFKVLEHIYNNPDRAFVNEMLNDIKPNLYSLMIFMYENGDLELLQYIDEHQLFKNKAQFIYSTIAYSIEPKSRRVKWPKKSPSEKIDEDVKKYFKLRLSDMSILKDILQIPKVVKPKTTKITRNPGKKLTTTNKAPISNKPKQKSFDDW